MQIAVKIGGWKPPLLARWEACRHDAEEVARRLQALNWRPSPFYQD